MIEKIKTRIIHNYIIMFDYIIISIAAIAFISNSHCVNTCQFHLSISILYVITTLITIAGVTLIDSTHSDSTDSTDSSSVTFKESTGSASTDSTDSLVSFLKN